MSPPAQNLRFSPIFASQMHFDQNHMAKMGGTKGGVAPLSRL